MFHWQLESLAQGLHRACNILYPKATVEPCMGIAAHVRLQCNPSTAKYALRCTSKHTSLHFLTCPSILFKWYPLCTAGLSSAYEVLTADARQIYCSDTADGHGRVCYLMSFVQSVYMASVNIFSQYRM